MRLLPLEQAKGMWVGPTGVAAERRKVRIISAGSFRGGKTVLYIAGATHA